MSRKRPAESSLPSRPAMTRSRRKTLDRKPLSELRSCEEIMAKIYSFLSWTDRLRLSEVDKQFLHDEQRGRVVGVYGDWNLSIKKALKTVEEYVAQLGSPENLLNNFKLPSCWDWLGESCSCTSCHEQLYHKIIEESWFSPSSDYNLVAIAESLEFCGEIENFKKLNYERRSNRRALTKLKTDVRRSLPLPGFGVLFELMEKNGIESSVFKSVMRPVVGFFDRAIVIEENGDWTRYLKDLRPGRIMLYRDGEGRQASKVIKKCGGCKKFQERIRDEYCAVTGCFGFAQHCGDCSMMRECSTCERTNCYCNVESCAKPGCDREFCICTDRLCDGSEEHDVVGEGCGYVIFPDNFDDDANDNFDAWQAVQSVKFCKKHKPDGAVKALCGW